LGYGGADRDESKSQLATASKLKLHIGERSLEDISKLKQYPDPDRFTQSYVPFLNERDRTGKLIGGARAQKMLSTKIVYNRKSMERKRMSQILRSPKSLKRLNPVNHSLLELQKALLCEDQSNLQDSTIPLPESLMQTMKLDPSSAKLDDSVTIMPTLSNDYTAPETASEMQEIDLTNLSIKNLKDQARNSSVTRNQTHNNTHEESVLRKVKYRRAVHTNNVSVTQKQFSTMVSQGQEDEDRRHDLHDESVWKLNSQFLENRHSVQVAQKVMFLA